MIRYWLHEKNAFRDYTTAGKGTGVLTIEDRVTLSLGGDWGTGTDEAQKVADCVQGFGPDFTIHLGDVYFVGDETEIKENFRGEPTSPYRPVKWPRGKLGSFALSGNHEMYARGNGYFESILPKMGLRKSCADWGNGQWASFFCSQEALIGGLSGWTRGITLQALTGAKCRYWKTANGFASRFRLSRGAHFPMRSFHGFKKL